MQVVGLAQIDPYRIGMLVYPADLALGGLEFPREHFGLFLRQLSIYLRVLDLPAAS